MVRPSPPAGESMVESQSVTLEEFARLTARIDAGESVEKVLAGSDLDADRWAARSAIRVSHVR